MKNNKGITLISLTVYIIVLMIVIALMSNLSRYFFKNINQITTKENGNGQYLRFKAFITKDISNENLIFVKNGVEDDKQYLLLKFKNGDIHEYICLNNNVYFLSINTNEIETKKIFLCNNVTNQNIFNYDDQKKVININFEINEDDYSSTFNVNI